MNTEEGRFGTGLPSALARVRSTAVETRAPPHAQVTSCVCYYSTRIFLVCVLCHLYKTLKNRFTRGGFHMSRVFFFVSCFRFVFFFVINFLLFPRSIA